MHAVFVLPRFFPYRGGYENVVLGYASALVERGHRATVYTTTANDLESLWVPGHRTFPSGETNVDGVQVRRFAISYDKLRRRSTRLLGLLPSWRLKAHYWRPGFPVPGLQKALSESDPDVIHIGPLPYNSLMYEGLRVAESKAVPLLATPCTHFGEDRSDEVARFYVQPYLMAMLKRCSRVLCLTDFERGRMTQLGIAPDNLAVVRVGVDSQAITGGSETRLRKQYGISGPIVLHLGMKAYEKGSVSLIEAMKRLWAGGSDAWLVMAGPSLAAFDAYVAANAGNCPKLINLPVFDDGQKPDLLAAATVVAQPSRVESLGIVVLEAWANRKPVITADIAVSRELVLSARGGTVVPFGDREKLADAIAGLLANDDLRGRMGQQGQAKVLSDYQASQVSHQYVDLFEQTASNGRP